MKNKLFKDSYINWSISILLFAVAFLNFYFFNGRDQEIPNAFQARDMQRAKDLFQSMSWIWHGPELSGGGYLPGPFYYYLIGVPIFIFNTIESVVFLKYILISLSAVLLREYFSHHVNKMTGYLVFVLYCTSYVLAFNSVENWNPSFAPLFFLSGIQCK